MNFHELWSIKYWLTVAPGLVSVKFLIILAVIFGGVFVFGVVSRFLARYYQKKKSYLAGIYFKLSTLSLTMGVFGLMYYFFIYENIYLLSARFWFLIWLIGLVWWLLFLVKFYYVKLPAEKKTLSEREIFEKYLPRPKQK